MKRTHLIFALVVASGCSEDGRKLLCTADEDCNADQVCERVSGLCKPRAEPPTFTMGGVSGAFDCPLPGTRDAGGAPPGVTANIETPGLATVIVMSPGFDPSCGDVPTRNGMPSLEGLKTGCTVQRVEAPSTTGGAFANVRTMASFSTAGRAFTSFEATRLVSFCISTPTVKPRFL